jgi:hydroxymethylglutaryl-CoA lyase
LKAAQEHLNVNSFVTLRDVGLRDGLQSIQSILSTEKKCEWIDAAYAAGVCHMEVGSFVPAHLMPQLADTADVVAHAKRHTDLHVTVLVPNLKGAERAIESGANALLLPISASAAHSAANVKKTPDQMIETVAAIDAMRKAANSPITIDVGISTAFGCTIQGDVPESEVVRIAKAAVAAGADEIGLADTVGYADPAQVKRLFAKVQDGIGARCRTAHFHDTRGLALANTVAALDAGIRYFDASLGGIGGCPHAPGASGNVSTEDVVYLLDRMGFETGIDLNALLQLRKRVSAWLTNEQFNGYIWRAGAPKSSPVFA